MAVCNALGSNIFEILVGLGLPWFIKTVVLTPGTPAVVQGKGKRTYLLCVTQLVSLMPATMEAKHDQISASFLAFVLPCGKSGGCVSVQREGN